MTAGEIPLYWRRCCSNLALDNSLVIWSILVTTFFAALLTLSKCEFLPSIVGITVTIRLKFQWEMDSWWSSEVEIGSAFSMHSISHALKLLYVETG